MAVVGSRYYTQNPFEFDTTGTPLRGGQLWSYLTGTATLLETFSDVNLTVPNANPIVADANGRFGSIFLSPSQAYKFVLMTAATALNPDGELIWVEDPCGPGAGGINANTVGIVGEIRQYAGLDITIPSGWYQCDGSAVSRTTFAGLFTVIGTLWGIGDGSTTFNLPDLRGRSMFGKDDMGGTPADRLTGGISGVPGSTIGGVGGDQSTQGHNHGLNDPGHNHVLTDPSHTHEQQLPNNAIGGASQQVQQFDGLRGGGPWGALETLPANTGITIDAASTNITLNPYGSGGAQNIPPAAIVYMIIYAGA